MLPNFVRSGLALSLILALAACGTVEVFPDAAVVIDGPDVDAPDIDAPDIDAPDIDAPDIDAPIDAAIDAPIDAAIDAPIDATPTHTVLLTLAGTGSGVVTSNPAGINCGADCSENFPMGTVVTLTATPSANSTFTGWSGSGCSGTGTCVVTVNMVSAVNATFTLRSYTLTVNRTGTGTGTVTSSPAGINCGTDCTEVYNHGQTVTLTASPAAGSTFGGWSGGGCSGTGTCVVTLTAATSVTADFDPGTVALTVTRNGTGAGTVTSSPAGINCGTDCTENVNIGTMVTLTATAAATPLASASTFTGWSGGGCSGTGTCVVTVNAATTVTATFALQPNVAFVTSTNNHTGNLGGLAGADAICQARAQAVNLPGTYRAWLSSSTVNAIDRFAGASGWVRTDGKPFANSRADLAADRLFTPLRITERMTDVGQTSVNTATTLNGLRDANSSTCADWTSATVAGTVTAGFSDAQGFMWTVFTGNGCAAGARLYCLGTDRAATVVPTPPASYRRAFTTNASFMSGGGLAAADNLCNSEASAAGLPGSYRALLATSTASAASRFNAAAGTAPWGRPDGVLCAPTAAEFFSLALLDSSPNTTANLSAYLGNYAVWGGASNVNVPGNVDLACVNWTGTGSGGSGGRIGFTTQTSRFSGDINGCSAGFVKLTCLQQ